MPQLTNLPTPEPQPTKRCYACKQEKPLDQFMRVKKKDGSTRPYAYCSECDNQKQRDRHRKKRGDKFREPPPQSDTEKWCPICKHLKPREMFAANKRTSDGLSGICKECCKPLIRKHYLKRQYGLDEHDYDIMLHEQNYVCAICKKPETVIHMGNVPSLSVDHCHKTKKVRGLLCYRCNHLVGFIERFGTEGLEAAQQYLSTHTMI